MRKDAICRPNLKRWREERGTSQAVVGEALGCGGKAVGHWETGIRTTPQHLLAAYACLLNVSVELLNAELNGHLPAMTPASKSALRVSQSSGTLVRAGKVVEARVIGDWGQDEPLQLWDIADDLTVEYRAGGGVVIDTRETPRDGDHVIARYRTESHDEAYFGIWNDNPPRLTPLEGGAFFTFDASWSVHGVVVYTPRQRPTAH